MFQLTFGYESCISVSSQMPDLFRFLSKIILLGIKQYIILLCISMIMGDLTIKNFLTLAYILNINFYMLYVLYIYSFFTLSCIYCQSVNSLLSCRFSYNFSYFFKSFTVLCFTFKSMIHFELFV